MTYEFSGVINSADPSTGAAAGTPFTGTFTYDAAEVPSLNGPIIEGSHQYTFGKLADNTEPGLVPDASNFSVQVGGQSVFSFRGGITAGVSELEFPG